MTDVTTQSNSPNPPNDLSVGEMPTPSAWQLPVALIAWLIWLTFLGICNVYST